MQPLKKLHVVLILDIKTREEKVIQYLRYARQVGHKMSCKINNVTTFTYILNIIAMWTYGFSNNLKCLSRAKLISM